MTAAPTAYSSSLPPPEPGETLPEYDALRMPAIAAMPEQIMNAVTLIRVTLMPARRAASALPPTA